MRRLAIFTLGALYGAAAFGQGPLECVDPDVIRGLLLGRDADISISAAMPPELEGIPVPAAFTWVGSKRGTLPVSTAPLTYVTGTYQTGLSPEAAHAAAIDELAATGWSVGELSPTPGMGVFNSTSQPIAQTACRDGEPFSVLASALEGRTYVSYRSTPGANSNACNPQRWAGASAAAQNGIDPHLPALDLPLDPVTGAAARLQSSGGGGNAAEHSARAEFRLDESVRDVAEHFARQIAEQGWTRDASWSGTTTAGSSWSKPRNGDTALHAELHVTAVAESQFSVVLRTLALQ